MGEERGRHVVGAVEVDGERRVPIGARVGVADLAAPDDPGVVDQHRDRSDLARDHAGEIVADGAVGHVAGVMGRVAADRLGRAFRRDAVDVDGNDARARLGHRERDAFADTGTGAGHEGQAARQQAFHALLTGLD
jgi:hypothetical protein